MVKRDGYCTSLWQDSVQPLKGTDIIPSQKHFDVIIVGGGITGVTSAYLLQNAGKKCLLLEAYNLGFGTTGGTTAHLNTLLDTPYTVIEKNFNEDAAKLVAEATAGAIQLIRQNSEDCGVDCDFEMADACLFAQDEKEEEELAKIAEACRRAGLHLFASPTNTVPVPYTDVIRVGGQARFNPMLYVQALARSFIKAGGVILEHCRVTDIDNKEPIIVHTEKSDFTSTDLIYATHIPPGVNLLHLRCVPYRSYAMAVTLTDGDYPEDLAYDMKDPYHYYRTQEFKGKQYLIAGGKDHKTGTVENTEECFRCIEIITLKTQLLIPQPSILPSYRLSSPEILLPYFPLVAFHKARIKINF